MGEVRVYPSRDQFEALRDFTNVPVAVSQEILLPPNWLISLWEEFNPYFLISESLRDGGPYSPYSYAAVLEKPLIYLKGDEIGSLDENFLSTVDVFKDLGNGSSPKIEGLPPFQGGYWTLLSYEMASYLEPYLKGRIKTSSLPGLVLFEVKEFLAYGYRDQRLFLVDTKDPGSSFPLKERYDQRIKSLFSRLNLLKERLTKDMKRDLGQKGLEYEPLTHMQDFLSKVQYLKDLIKAGECIQAVLSQRFRVSTPSNPFEVYTRLRQQDPSPYCTFLRLNDFYLIAASPEMLIRHEDGLLISRPIAGTRARAKNALEDKLIEDSLLGDPKELAEHMMLVDLARNDLGRVSVPGSVKMAKLKIVERYSNVMHMVSEVVARPLPHLDLFHLLQATFPAGTVTGAPKIRAMEIIEEVEMIPRGPYAGGFGFIGYNGFLDLGITIRSAFGTKDEMYVQAGAGIVNDSVPSLEYQETLNKARSLLKAFQGGGDDI